MSFINSTSNHILIFIVIFLFYGVSTNAQNFTCNYTSSCGCSRSPVVLTRIVGGEDTAAETWGWMVSIRLRWSNTHLCGGSIINPSYILTAAHCTAAVLSVPYLLQVAAGSINSNTPTQVRNVIGVYDHPSFSSTNYLNDISILKLSRPLDFGDASVQKICLPGQLSNGTDQRETPFPDTNVVAIGWGKLTEASISSQNILQQVTLKVVNSSSSYCRNALLSNTRLQMCAGIMPDGGKDTCQGDSGGPLLRFTENRIWEQVGIVSFGYGCARPYYAGVYTRVAAYRSWIDMIASDGNGVIPSLITTLFMIISFSLFA